jgi:hypothetical protein
MKPSPNSWVFLFKGMTWKDINVFQWQQITELFTKESKDLTELDLAYKATAIAMDLTENQIDSLPIDQLKPLLEQVKFLHDEIKPEPAKFIQVNGKRYRCIYDVRKMPAARYIESKYFDQDRTGNLHKLAACMVMPQRKNWLGQWVDDKFDASKHAQYADDMLAAPITAVLGSVVFFYQVYNNWIRNSKDYLIKEMMTQGMTRYQAEKLYIHLCEIMDGYIKPSWLLNTKPLGWKKFMVYLQSNS